MVESNKILTVSYGTFSCTLEGFDDSFGTMKAIAEYFRDLAAGDRYFGAEPPTPDADMLARIAEREITRRVEARMESSGLVLRATGAIGDDDSAAAPAVAMPPAKAPRAAIQAAVPAQVSEPAAAASTPGHGHQEHSNSDHSATADREEDIDGSGVSLLAASDPEMVQPAPQDMPEVLPVDLRVAEPLDAPAPETPQRAGRTIRVAPAHPDADSVAAKLQRIRAVVGKASTGIVAEQAADYVEDLNVADMAAEMAPEAASVTDSASDDDFLSRFAAENDLSIGQDDTDDAETDDLSDLDTEELAFDDDLVAAAPELASEDWATDDLMGEELVKDEQPDLATAAPSALVLDDTDTVSDADADDDEDEDSFDLAAVMAASEPQAAPAPAPIRARVIRMKRAEFESAIESGLIEEDNSAPQLAPELPPELPADNVAALDGIDELERFASVTTETALDQADEDDLMAELAQVQREIAASTPADIALSDEDEDEDDEDDFEEDYLEDDFDSSDDLDDDAVESVFAGADDSDSDDMDDDEEVSELTAQPLRPTRPGRAFLQREPEEDEAALSRILSKTDDQLNEPESNRRRAAIAQLKAAVAATEAARQMGEPKSDEEDAENAFRDDLSQVVRPRRAEVADRRSERPRPAPLKLVASQRIDVDAEAAPRSVTPVRPRRVAVDEAPAVAPQPTPAAATAGSFADFAEDMGARDLGELLEAAAAYTSFVEGLEDFSRPQLMKKVREAAGEDFSREDGLRSFGTLLRQGRIEKISNGRFQVSEQTRYRPEPRAARG